MMYAVILLLSSWISFSAAILPGSVFTMKSYPSMEQGNPALQGSIFDNMKNFQPSESVTQPTQGSVFDNMKSFQPGESVTQPTQALHGTIGLAPKPAITQPPPPEKMEKHVGDWTLVYRARAENEREVAFSYVHPFGTNEMNALPGCLSTSGSAKCNGNYRHSAIDKWRSLNVKRVKVELYKGSLPVAFIVFNGTNSGATSWFNRKKVLSSSWTDIMSRGDYFSFFGRKDELVNRRLYINKASSSCKDDIGWMIVVESKGECPYDNAAKHPIFLYSSHSTQSLYMEHGKQAEVLAIYVDAEELKPPPQYRV
ncbi:uncharacterized protein LOC117323920 isoform X2 [Pecten maximus]|uniref:uncharacterized protein LOC117323920 isoform X2 n=1 Tax=Pecten maximus TaxID=6579 RepID=UPI00145907EC|nr:uncharacterized protein LOC117323920 isoform X2 [Pecten maximus]